MNAYWLLHSESKKNILQITILYDIKIMLIYMTLWITEFVCYLINLNQQLKPFILFFYKYLWYREVLIPNGFGTYTTTKINDGFCMKIQNVVPTLHNVITQNNIVL